MYQKQISRNCFWVNTDTHVFIEKKNFIFTTLLSDRGNRSFHRQNKTHVGKINFDDWQAIRQDTTFGDNQVTSWQPGSSHLWGQRQCSSPALVQGQMRAGLFPNVGTRVDGRGKVELFFYLFIYFLFWRFARFGSGVWSQVKKNPRI